MKKLAVKGGDWQTVQDKAGFKDVEQPKDVDPKEEPVK